MTAQAQRVDWVDTAKAICIVFVVMMHSTLGVEKAAGATGFMGHVVEFARPFRMPDFFLISGLFLARVIDRDWRTFLDRRVVHFFYFYLLWLSIQIAVKAPGLIADGGVEGLVRLYLTSIVIEPFGTLWFVWILPFFALAVRLTRRLPVALVFAVAALLEIAPIHTGLLPIDEGAARFVYFFAGYAFAGAVFRLAETADRHRGLAIAGLVAWGLINGGAVAAGWADQPGLSLLLGGAGAMAIVTTAVLVSRVPRLGALGRFVGSHSIVVYLAFFLPMAATRSLLLATGIVPDVGWMSVIVTVVAVVVPFGLWWLAIKTGAGFLFERPAFARLAPMRLKTSAVPAE